MGRPARLALTVITTALMVGASSAWAGEGTESVPPPLLSPAGQAHTVTVETGDHFWLLAEKRLESSTGNAPGDSEVAPYWLGVVEENRNRIRSGDPNLIFPGEQVVLPAIE